MRNLILQEVSKRIPTDEFPRGIIIDGIYGEWFVVGPRCLELFHQFRCERMPEFIDPYIRRLIVSEK